MMKFENGSDSYGSAGSGGSGGSGTSGCGDDKDLPVRYVRQQYADTLFCEGYPLTLTGDAWCAFTQKEGEAPHFKGVKFEVKLFGRVDKTDVDCKKDEEKDSSEYRSAYFQLSFSAKVHDVEMNYEVPVQINVHVWYDSDTKEIKTEGSMYHKLERKY